MPVDYGAHFDWSYERERPEMARLYEAAKASQWNASADLDWSKSVDPADPGAAAVPDASLPVRELAVVRAPDARRRSGSSGTR